MNQLDSLTQFITAVADSGDWHPLAQFQPRDTTEMRLETDPI